VSEQTPSGNRWEPTAPADTAAPAQVPAAQTFPADSGETAVARAGRTEWLRRALARPSRQAWIAGFVGGLLVVTGAGGFLLGRASVHQDERPGQFQRDWGHGPDDGDGADRGPDRAADTLSILPALPPDERSRQAA
jgi:hypothetical protein